MVSPGRQFARPGSVTVITFLEQGIFTLISLMRNVFLTFPAFNNLSNVTVLFCGRIWLFWNDLTWTKWPWNPSGESTFARIDRVPPTPTHRLSSCRFRVVASELSLPSWRFRVVASKLSLPSCRFHSWRDILYYNVREGKGVWGKL